MVLGTLDKLSLKPLMVSFLTLVIKLEKLRPTVLHNLPKIISLENGGSENHNSTSDSKAVPLAACVALEVGLEE